MRSADDRDGARAAALGLVGVLAPVLADVAGTDAVRGARATAQVLGLAGLERLLAVCAPRAGLAWPAELIPALSRVRRLAARTAETGDLAAFREADHELAGLADEISSLHWSTARRFTPGAAAPVATLALCDALDDLPLADDSSREIARRARLLPPVAAALRAALDWLGGGGGRPLALRAEESLLEVQCEHVDAGGLAAASDVLAAVGANLGPALGAPGPWIVRVPLRSERDIYLMIVSGGVPLAIPWHAVLRLHMAPAGELTGRAAPGGWPVVARSAGVDRSKVAGEVPMALVAHGRKRAWVVADRLVWRLPADPVAPTEPAPVEGLAAMVGTEEGEPYWLADPGWLLREIEAPSLEKPAPPTPAPVADAPAPAASVPAAAPPTPASAPRPAPAPPAAAPPATATAAAPPAAPPHPAPRLALLTTLDVEPVELERSRPPARPAVPLPPPRSADARPGEASVVVPAPAPAVAPAPGARTARAALVAEDSITARIFLARLLTRLGFDVRTVDTAAALRNELERGAWSLVCVDVELPDEAGAAFLAALVVRYGERTPFVALVRDADDRAGARRAGIERMLRKPFDHQELELVLGRLGLLAGRRA